jgi:TPR repeat protein
MRAALTLALTLTSACWLSAPAFAERLTLTFLPPDLPPSNICNAPIERFDASETQVADDSDFASETEIPDERIAFLSRDIRDLRRDDPNGAFDFIMALITRRAELDADYAGIDETFDRVDTYLAARRIDDLRRDGLLTALTEQIIAMGWGQTVRLARYYMNGIGVDKDRDFAKELIVDKAYLGSAGALLEVLRMKMRGEELDNWVLDTEETARLAYGGLIGRPNRGLCGRAERMALEYLEGDILTPNPDLAFAWRKFAADMGGAEASWRMVEHYLSATGEQSNQAALRHYLEQAVEGVFVGLPATVQDIAASGAEIEEEVRRILRDNHARVGQSDRKSAVPYLDMDARLASMSIAEAGIYLEYLYEIAELPNPPGSVLTRLAKEIGLRKGRWKGREEIDELLRRATALGEPEAAVLLARSLITEREDPQAVSEAEALLTGAVARHGHAEAMRSLDTLYRCQMPDGPHLETANHWSQAYRAAGIHPVSISAGDLARLDPERDPEVIAHLHALALTGHGGSSASWLQYLQSDAASSTTAIRHWAGRVSRSDLALETYLRQEFELAITPLQRKSTVELFRRAYLDIGSAVSLDLALTLVEHAGRDPDTAAEIEQLLRNSASRGEGAAIRLLQRLTGADGADIYAEFAGKIEARGDFIATLYAAPYISNFTFRRYMKRAVSMMKCTTKDITEIMEVYAARGWDEETLHWLRVGQAVEGGNTLMRLGLTNRQIDDFARGTSIASDLVSSPSPVADRYDRLRQLYLAASAPNAPKFDPDAAGQHLATILSHSDRDEYFWAVAQYRQADPTVRRVVDAEIDVRAGLTSTAKNGDTQAQFELGMLMRALAENASDLETSANWFNTAAQGGNADAMVELARAVGFGIGQKPDPKLALIWLDRAERLNPNKGGKLRTILEAMIAE